VLTVLFSLNIKKVEIVLNNGAYFLPIIIYHLDRE